MIYTVTLNPALDYVVSLPRFLEGAVNRTQSEHIFAGGKGVNISVVLTRLGIENTALGFVAGFTGAEIERLLSQEGVRTEFIHTEKGFSRINIKVKCGMESEINGRGPELTQWEIQRLFMRLDALEKGDTLCLAGSVPSCLPPDIYEQILARLSGRDIRVTVDAEGDLLFRALAYQPFLIKPNRQELSALCGRQAESWAEVERCARELQHWGAQNVLVSCAEAGAMLLTADGVIYQSGAPEGTAVNSAGAGDSMLAGFLAGYTDGIEKALHLGIAAGSATAFSHGLATKEAIDGLLGLAGAPAQLA